MQWGETLTGRRQRYAGDVEARTSIWAIVALGASLQRFDEVRANTLGLVRALEADGHHLQAQALRAHMQLSYAADDLAALSTHVLRTAQRQLLVVAGVSSLCGALAGAAVVLGWLVLQ